jgi:hypothetical protein
MAQEAVINIKTAVELIINNFNGIITALKKGNREEALKLLHEIEQGINQYFNTLDKLKKEGYVIK